MNPDLFLILTLVFAVVFPLVLVYRYARHPKTTKLRERLMLLTLALMIVGGECFLAFGLIVANIIKLPNTFEWPAGNVHGIARTPEGNIVVPLFTSARVQLYDSNLHFIRGWHVETGGKSFTVAGYG